VSQTLVTTPTASGNVVWSGREEVKDGPLGGKRESMSLQNARAAQAALCCGGPRTPLYKDSVERFEYGPALWRVLVETYDKRSYDVWQTLHENGFHCTRKDIQNFRQNKKLELQREHALLSGAGCGVVVRKRGRLSSGIPTDRAGSVGCSCGARTHVQCLQEEWPQQTPLL